MGIDYSMMKYSKIKNNKIVPQLIQYDTLAILTFEKTLLQYEKISTCIY